MSGARSAPTRITPHEELAYRDGRSRAARAPIRAASRSARPGSTTTMTATTRRAGDRLSPPYRGVARDRSAPGHPRPLGRRGHRRDPRGREREGGVPVRAALLLGRHRPGAPRARARRLHLVLGHSDVQECRDDPRGRRASLRPTASWSRPMRRISRRCRIAARATSRASCASPPNIWPSVRGVSLEQIGAETTANFYRLF